MASCLGKVTERTVLFLLEWKATLSTLAGFHWGHSTVSLTSQHLFNKHRSVVPFPDIKGAFNNVAHDAILNSVEAMGTRQMFEWIRDYIAGWSFFVWIDEGQTAKHYTYCGVPQGGILSPALFNVALIGLADVLPMLVCPSIYKDDICLWNAAVTRFQLCARIQQAATLTAYLQAKGLAIST